MHRFEALFEDPRIVTLAARVDDADLASLTEDERALVARAVDKRKREFATGRRLARAALEAIGLRGVEILAAPDRAPVWPEGIRGSISHSDRHAVVAVTNAEHGTVGVDVEHRAELARDLWRRVFLPRELDELDAAFGPKERGRMALVSFSAKESLYKAQYPRTSTFMGFQELHVTPVPDPSDPQQGTVVCTFQNDVGDIASGGFARGSVARGRYLLGALGDGEIVTSVFIPRTRT